MLARILAYLRRFFTTFVQDDPDPDYSNLDRDDGLGEQPSEPEALAAA